ncbi:MAG: hypothetical protein PF495_07330 [Spirochaetales bacterium]|jgi:hypothetical protein|nr:hypothetical protein [Spirochaetales bacterium]
MKIKYYKQLLFALAVSCMGMMSTGCTTRLVDFTVISTKNIDWSNAEKYKRTGNRIEGKDTAHIIIFIPTGIPNIKEAIDRAIEGVPGGVALVDGVLSQNSWYIPYIYGQNSIIVEGSVLFDPTFATSSLPDPYMIARIDQNGNLESITGVSQSHYEEVKKKAL